MDSRFERVEDRQEDWSYHLRCVLVQSEDYLEDNFAIVHLLALEFLVAELGSQLVQEILVGAEVPAHVVGLLLEDSIVVGDQVIDQSEDVRLESHIEACIHSRVSDQLSEEGETLPLCDEPSFGFEAVRAEPCCQAVEG